MTASAVEFVDIDWSGRRVRIEHQWLARERGASPLIVFLHEGLGSLSMWKDFPQRLCDAAGCRGLVYSRPGYGRSTPRAAEEVWGLDFMHRQAHEVLPALLRALAIDATVERPWLFGHSDGGSIALLYAARFPSAGGRRDRRWRRTSCVEDLSVRSIDEARRAYLDTDLRERLARYHDDPDSAFWGWNRHLAAPAVSRVVASRTRSGPSAARCWRCRVWTTSTAHWSRSAALPAACRRRSCWNCPTAGIRRSGISRNG